MISTKKSIMYNIMTFLPIKDILRTSQINKNTFMLSKKHLNGLYREEMNKYFFCSDNYINIFENNKKIIKEIENQSYLGEINWYNLFKEFVQLRKNFQNSFEPLRHMVHFKNDIVEFENVLYDCLKYHNYISKIRKVNHNLENEFFSLHQIFFSDFIREENDVYDFYNNYFEESKDNKENNFLRNDEIPLKSFLEKFEDIKYLFMDESDSRECLKDIFNYNLSHLTSFSRINCNPILYSVVYLYKYVILFCKMTFWYIKKYAKISSTSSELFWNEYIIRYESFIASSLKINEKCENLNVSINYLYSLLFHQTVTKKKFNIYKFLLNIWYQEVVIPFTHEDWFYDNMKMLINKFVNDEIESFQQYEPKQSFTKTIVEQIANAFLDLDCNENTISYINNTNMPTTFLYNYFDQSICESIVHLFTERLNYHLINKEKILSFYENLKVNKPYNFINKTLFNISQSILISLKPKINHDLVLSLESFSKNFTSEKSLQKSVYYEENENITNAIQNEINEIEQLLIRIGVNNYQMKVEAAQYFSKQMINSNNCPIMIFLFKLFKSYYEHVDYFDKINKKVEKTIKKKRQPSTSCLIELGKKKLEEKDNMMNINETIII